jgi:serine/threonine protein kinase
MIISLLGNSLEDLFKKWRRKFSIPTIAGFAIQALDRVNHCFTNEFLHRDIKPDNFMVGNKDPDTIYL